MDGSVNVGVFTENGSLKHWNILADGVSGRVKEDSSKVYYLKDHLGSIRAVIDEAGEIQESHDYYPFGLEMPKRRRVSDTDSLFTKELFTGKERDSETGLDYFGARYYDASIGRWLSVDPLAEKYPGFTPYSYVGNRPLSFIDINGMEWYWIWEEEEDEEGNRKGSWQWFENTPEKEIWIGEYKDDGSKKIEKTKGKESLLTFEDGDLVFREAYGDVKSFGEIGELEFPQTTEVFVNNDPHFFGPSEPQIGYIPFGPGGFLKYLRSPIKSVTGKPLRAFMRFEKHNLPKIGRRWHLNIGGKGSGLPIQLHIHRGNIFKPWLWGK